MTATASKPNGNGRGPRVPLAPVLEPQSTAAVMGVGTEHLDAAVSIVQAAAPQLSRNARGQIGSRGYGYATLDAIVDAVLPLLVEQGLVWKTLPTMVDGAPALRYRMTHIESGESDEDTMPLLCDQISQGLGSGITYGRRYALTAYLNLTVDPDDDGISANLPAPVDRYADAEATHAQRTQDRPTAPPRQQSGGRAATVRQRNMLRAKARDAGLSASRLADEILVATGNERRRMEEDPAELWLTPGLERLPATAVDAVLAGIQGGLS
jgi:hypothetical protein